jgi:catechol 2,3-dioxygenase-like lactoylglutathione lyase family enzyme
VSFLRSGGVNYIGVRDITAAIAWYIEKLGLRKILAESDDCPECVALGFSKDEYAVTLASPDRPRDELTPIFFTGNARRAREFRASRGVRVGQIQQDRQETQYFEMQDLEGNVIEIAEEP